MELSKKSGMAIFSKKVKLYGDLNVKCKIIW